MKLTTGIAASTARQTSTLARPNSHSSTRHVPYHSFSGQLLGQSLFVGWTISASTIAWGGPKAFVTTRCSSSDVLIDGSNGYGGRNQMSLVKVKSHVGRQRRPTTYT